MKPIKFNALEPFLVAARKLRDLGEGKQAVLHLGLLDMEPRIDLWGPRYNSWEALLVTERLSSPDRYRRVRSFVRRYGRATLMLFGVPAAVLLDEIRAEDRNEAVNRTRAWIAKHKTRPTAFAVRTIAREIRPAAAIQETPAMAKRTKLAAALRHVRKLEAMLAAHGLPVPEFESRCIAVTPVDCASMVVRATAKLRSFYPSLSDVDLVNLASQLVITAGLDPRTPIPTGTNP